jgi:hypothetical protein
VLIFLANAPKGNANWIHSSYQATQDGTLAGRDGFDQKECIFLSHVFAMRSTQKLEILNSDPIGHNTNIAPTKGAQPFNQTIPAGATTLYAPGGESSAPFPVSCSIHPWMSAWMITRDNPCFAVSKPDGSFEIPYAPAGVELEFRIWQEAAKFVDGTVMVNGQATKLSKGKFTLTLEPDKPTSLEFVIDSPMFQ